MRHYFPLTAAIPPRPQQVIARHEGHLDMEGQIGFLKKVPGFE